MNCDQYTIKGGTVTSEGFVPHKRHPAGFNMPVKLIFKKCARSDRRVVAMLMEDHPPLRNVMGNLVYALPGGDVFSE